MSHMHALPLETPKIVFFANIFIENIPSPRFLVEP